MEDVPTAVDTDLLLLEERRVEQGIFHDWREAGEALERIRDERLYEPEYRSFQAYIEGRFQIDRADRRL